MGPTSERKLFPSIPARLLVTRKLLFGNFSLFQSPTLFINLGKNTYWGKWSRDSKAWNKQ